MKLTEKVCERCETPFMARADQRFCTQQCWLKKHNSPERNALVARQTATKRGDILRDRGEGKSYRKVNQRHEHRAVAEDKIGRALRVGEIVHHLDGNKRNNAPENLEVLPSQSEHMRRHMLERAHA